MATKKLTAEPRNPFVTGGTVSGEDFTDRAKEIERIRAVLIEPQAKLLVYGPRRMGKTSALDQAVQEVTQAGGLAFRADLSGSTTLADVATRIMQGTAAVVGRRWRDAITSFLSRLSFSFSATPDPATGLIVPGVSVEQRTQDLAVQQGTLESVLAAADALAAEREVTLGIVLDEFQTIHRFGGEAAEWHLRGLLQGHRHLAYVAAGSEVGLITAMTGSGRAFYKLFDVMSFGPIEPGHMAEWIDGRMAQQGIASSGLGEAIVNAAGPRTRDIVQLARATYAEGVPTRSASVETVHLAFARIVAEESEILRAIWEGLGMAQQNVLRAIAANASHLHAMDTRRQFGLKSTAEVTQALKYLAKNEIIAQSEEGYVVDSPFLRGWIRLHALADVGIRASLL